ncbi:phosphotransferase [Shewanella sp. 5_MG-2023]|uniref:phosphotransferase n=1 Tax=Shewanella sp. 5_MG-2023 TaxID=3062656 RepID=UPI0026E45EBA|nr:phosphotransferase [Shewanella sp. 5_MG-2023]MDO6641485.1 phosphotransferase [Shewanella sp. 5_MG-2023]
MTIDKAVISKITTALKAQSISEIEVIQSLWGGYGELFRAKLTGSQYSSVIVKHIKLPQPESHPKGWNSALSHQRKLKSYQVEANWYQHYAQLCGSGSGSGSDNDRQSENSVPQCLYIQRSELETLLILEDLHTLGFDQVLTHADHTAILASLKWLGHFHGQFMANQFTTSQPSTVNTTDLWPTGSYWHLDTRPDELQALSDQPLKMAANTIDRTLKQTPYQTIIHGDAKLANFCFNTHHDKAAAVDFQYVGQGCGMKDVILLLSSTLTFTEPHKLIEQYLDYYFSQLASSINLHQPDINPKEVEQTWRPLYCIAWADFQRFIKGWSPKHVKINAYTEMLTAQALSQLTTSSK